MTPVGRLVGSLISAIAKLPRDDPEFVPLVKQLTSNFDDFGELPDTPVEAKAAGPARGRYNKFVGYTFKR